MLQLLLCLLLSERGFDYSAWISLQIRLISQERVLCRGRVHTRELRRRALTHQNTHSRMNYTHARTPEYTLLYELQVPQSTHLHINYTHIHLHTKSSHMNYTHAHSHRDTHRSSHSHRNFTFIHARAQAHALKFPLTLELHTHTSARSTLYHCLTSFFFCPTCLTQPSSHTQTHSSM